MTDEKPPVLDGAQQFVIMAVTGAQDALTLSHNLLTDAKTYRALAAKMRCDEHDRLHEQMTENSPDGERRMRMTRAYHEMSLGAAKASIEMATKALWFRQVVDDHGGDAAQARAALVDEVKDGGPLAKMRELMELRDAIPPLSKGKERNQIKEVNGIVDEAKGVILEAKRDAAS